MSHSIQKSCPHELLIDYHSTSHFWDKTKIKETREMTSTIARVIGVLSNMCFAFSLYQFLHTHYFLLYCSPSSTVFTKIFLCPTLITFSLYCKCLLFCSFLPLWVSLNFKLIWCRAKQKPQSEQLAFLRVVLCSCWRIPSLLKAGWRQASCKNRKRIDVIISIWH